MNERILSWVKPVYFHTLLFSLTSIDFLHFQDHCWSLLRLFWNNCKSVVLCFVPRPAGWRWLPVFCSVSQKTENHVPKSGCAVSSLHYLESGASAWWPAADNQTKLQICAHPGRAQIKLQEISQSCSLFISQTFFFNFQSSLQKESKRKN